MGVRKLIDNLRDYIKECHVIVYGADGEENENNHSEVQYALDELDDIETVIDNIEGWNNEVKDVITKIEGSEYLEQLMEELTEPVESIGREVY